MDNFIFNVNGRTKEQLKLAVALLMLDEYNRQRKISGWYYLQDKGFVLTWISDQHAQPFTDRMGNKKPIEQDELVEILWDWLKTEQAKSTKFDPKVQEANIKHDGSNEKGWRLYTENWGHIYKGSSIDHYSICAFKPCYLWYGK